jgi:ComF family protein
MKNIINKAVNLIFPKKCLICSEILKNSDDIFCESCTHKIKIVSSNCCYNCARDNDMCACRGYENSFDKVIAAFYYIPPISQLLVGLKIKSNDKKLKSLAEIIKNNIDLKYHGIKFDMITGVPSLKEEQNKEGNDRIEILCRFLSTEINIKYEKAAIKKIRKTSKQHDLRSHERYVNLKGAFLADSEIVANKNILLIDDIVTTASTLNACALELKNKGAKNVYCAAISTTILIDSQKNTKNI